MIIRDMILHEYSRRSDWRVESILEKIKGNDSVKNELVSFEEKWGEIKDLRRLNHLLLKYMYTDNWDHEIEENYTAVTFEKYMGGGFWSV